MNGLALCAGVGGLELGLRLAIGDSYRTVGYVEREAYAAAVLVARMEDAILDKAPIWDDVTTFDGRAWRGLVDVVSAGYPCQPFSVAGKRRGADDPRHLWPHIARIIRECEPVRVFLENVGGHLRLGFREVAEELRGMGYNVAAGLFTAGEVGAASRRQRLLCLASNNHSTRLAWRSNSRTNQKDAPNVETWSGSSDLAACAFWGNGCCGPALGRALHGMADRVDRVRAIGNGVVPIVAAYAYRTLAEALK